MLTAWAGNLSALLVRRRTELRMCVRVTASGVLSVVASKMLNLPLSIWAVLTAIILTQVSVGKSLRSTFDYFTSTLGGALYAGAVGTLVSPESELARISTLAAAVAPAAYLAAINPRFTPAPFTAALVLLAPSLAHVPPAAAALDRLIEVAVGGTVGLFVSVLVLPVRAHDLAISESARLLRLMADALATQIGKTIGSGFQGVPELSAALANLEVIAAEAQQERATRLAAEPDEAPLLRAMVRLRHDLVMIGRAAAAPLPKELLTQFASELAGVSDVASHWLRTCAAALLAQRKPASLDAFKHAVQRLRAAVHAIDRDKGTPDMPLQAADRIVVLEFALEQFGGDLETLAQCVTALSKP